MLKSLKAIHPTLALAYEKIYQPLQLSIENISKEKESSEFAAATFTLNGIWVKFRVAHITPTKTGQFVTLWKRENERAPIKPYDNTDLVDWVIVTVQKDSLSGLFIFPKEILLKKGIFSQQGKGGKRAFRVYPPWDKNLNKQAQSTQQWQFNYFLLLSDTLDIQKTNNVFSLFKVPQKPQ